MPARRNHLSEDGRHSSDGYRKRDQGKTRRHHRVHPSIRHGRRDDIFKQPARQAQ
jgi:hypothetical protein